MTALFLLLFDTRVRFFFPAPCQFFAFACVGGRLLFAFFGGRLRGRFTLFDAHFGADFAFFGFDCREIFALFRQFLCFFAPKRRFFGAQFGGFGRFPAAAALF